MSELPKMASKVELPEPKRDEVLTPHRVVPKKPEPEWVTVLDVDMGKPVHVGRFPVRTELTVLPADPPGREPLGWTVRTYEGTEVYKVGAPETVLTGKGDLVPGDRVIVHTLVGAIEMVVLDEEDDGSMWAESVGTVADLRFDTDDRHCWVSTFAMNKRLLEGQR